MTLNKPNGITADRHMATISIDWTDGHLSIYPFTLLRVACPCAECRGGHENMSIIPPDVFTATLEDSPTTRMKNIERIGNYAITIEWEDGHHFGIYNWGFLRSLCPCPICSPNRSVEN